MAQNSRFETMFEATVNALSGRPNLLLHACCAPCASAVLERLVPHFAVTVFFYNPNIGPQREFDKRVEEMRRFLKEAPFCSDVALVVPDYEPMEFYGRVKGLESCEERGERCRFCYGLRLARAVQYAEENGFDYVTTTLTVSPLKDAAALNTIGSDLAEGAVCSWLFSDFKKKDGYKRSVALSTEYGLYRQNYCGCLFSKRNTENENA